jgi:hypothetical protein
VELTLPLSYLSVPPIRPTCEQTISPAVAVPSRTARENLTLVVASCAQIIRFLRGLHAVRSKRALYWPFHADLSLPLTRPPVDCAQLLTLPLTLCFVSIVKPAA